MESQDKFPSKPTNEDPVDEARRGFLRTAFAVGVGAIAGSAVRDLEKFNNTQQELPANNSNEQPYDNSWEAQNLGPLIEQLTNSEADQLAITEARDELVAEAIEYEEKIKKVEELMVKNQPASAQYQIYVNRKMMLEIELSEKQKYIDGYTQIISKFDTMPTRDNNSRHYIQGSAPQGQPEASLATYSNKQIM